MKLDALDHPKTLDLAARRTCRYPDEAYMNTAERPVLPVAARAPRLPQDVWRAIKDIVHDVSGYTCRYCMRNVEAFAICDHVIPLARGGGNEIENLATACSDCNASKGMLTADEFDQKRRTAYA